MLLARSGVMKYAPVSRHRIGFWLVAFLGITAIGTQAASVIQFSATSYTGTEGLPEVAFVVGRSGDLDTVVSVDFATRDGTATAGADYLAISTNLTFEAGETSKTLAIPILNDGLVETVETLQVRLSNPGDGAVLGTRSSATGRITDNDKGVQMELPLSA